MGTRWIFPFSILIFIVILPAVILILIVSPASGEKDVFQGRKEVTFERWGVPEPEFFRRPGEKNYLEIFERKGQETSWPK